MARGPDHEALALLRRRDPRGFDLAYAAYAARLRGFLLRLSGRSDVADDLLQHAFLRLAERGPELRADSDLRAWLFTVARNAYLSRARSLGADGDDVALQALPSPATDDVEARLLLGDVERALAALRLDDRELLLLVGVEGMEPMEVAALLGVDAATLRQRLTRARARLLAELARLPAAAVRRRTSP
jgi:RNA polymerase sigma-70 factor, ECF subfamily